MNRRSMPLMAFALFVAAPVGFSMPGRPAFNGMFQSRMADARSLRCTFPLNATGTFNKAGPPEAAVRPAALVLLFDSVNTDEGTAQLKNGTLGSEIIVRSTGRYLHFMQSFRSGALYTTTVFDKETGGGKFRAVHSRHEYFEVPLSGATSSPEQYYGECEVVK